jgi:hypothetical protein
MTMAKLILDDEGFEILGNTLLLGYAIKKMERQKWPSSDDENSVSRLEYSESSELRDVLESAGAHDRRLAGGIDATGGPLIESFPDIFKRWATLANSNADLASLRLKEIDFASYLPAGSELLTALERASGYELRTPLAILGPTELTRCVKKMVLGYYSEDAEIFDTGVVVPEESSTRHNSRSGRGYYVEDEPFVEFAMDLLKSKRAKNPNKAMLMIEDGLWKEVAPEEKSFIAAVEGTSIIESKRMRLYKQVKTRWTLYQKSDPK